MRPLYELGNAAVVALPSPHHDAAFAQPILRTYRREEFSLSHPSFSFLQGERHRPLYFQETSTPHAIPTVHNPHSRCSRIQPSHSTLEMAEAPAQCPQGDRTGPLCCVCGDMWGTLSPPYSFQSLDCVEGGDV